MNKTATHATTLADVFRYALPAFFVCFTAVGAARIPAETLARSGAGLSPVELKIWNDPAFQRRFAESYLAEVEIEPRVTVDEREQMQKALELISADKLDEAAAMLQKERERNAAVSAVFDFTVANIDFQQEKLDEAAAAYQIAVEKYPKFRRAWKNLALIHVRQGAFEKALPELTRVVELGGNDAVTYGLLGFAYSSVEDYLAAESAYRMAILLDPKTQDWKMGLVRSFFKQERFAEAAALCRGMLEESPDRADLWLLQANAYIGLNQPLKAVEIYEIVDSLGESTVDSLNMMGDIYLNEELFELAVDAYERAIRKDSQGRPDRAVRAARVLAARGALDETRRFVEQVETAYGSRLESDDKKDLLKLRARIAVAEGAGDEEANVLKEIVELDPLDGEALILLGRHAGRGGDTEQAVFYYERAAGLEKFEADAKVRHAQLLVGNGKYDEALPLLRRAQQINPRDNIQKYLEQVERVAKTR
jgi:tetratricopeptide (TPR) repeat protein